MTVSPSESAALLGALRFSADKHRDQRRQDRHASPYINHPISVAEVLARVGGVADTTSLIAAVLHDTIEDTETTGEELERLFGTGVRRIVEEVTDDKSLKQSERKRLQIEKALRLSDAAKLVKLGDKICNVIDVTHSPPQSWDIEQRREYIDWTERVIAGCRGVNTALERRYDEVLEEARRVLFKDRR